ncbi:MAG TPA: formyltransferase family protein, partial [Ktedonobacterales bacterium]|nr:formyltransferase family protein [Ktedonobacterales bacterium]
RTLAAYDADALCVACWPRRLPAPLLTLPRLGALNLHPSLLPAHRGPAPLFRTLRHGDGHAGVSIHVMDETLDGGPLLAQVPIELADGMTGAEIERKCATVGGQLMADAVRALASGDVRPATQPADRGSYESWPTPADFVVTPEHSARWAFNFIKGAAYWGGPLVIRAGGQSFAVQTALDYTVAQPSHAPETAGKVRRVDNELWLACSPGTLHVRLAEPTARERLAHAPSATLRARDASDQ